MNQLTNFTRGLAQWQWIGALVARLALGLLFFLSGTGKLFVKKRRDQMRETISKAGGPAPSVGATVISLIEFLGGAALLAGFLTPISCVLLIGVMIGALATTILPSITAKSSFDWISDFLYLPEVLYLIILLWLLLSGPGRFSVDRWLLQ